MPLALDLKHGDKIIINGAVIENSGHNTQVLVHNDAAILRGKEIMVEETANTPATRAYFALQCAYVFPASRRHYLQMFDELLMAYLEACPTAREIGRDIAEKLNQDSIYPALKAARKLVTHEKKLMNEMGLEITPRGFAPIKAQVSASAKPAAVTSKSAR